jgi:hypothetical protein
MSLCRREYVYILKRILTADAQVKGRFSLCLLNWAPTYGAYWWVNMILDEDECSASHTDRFISPPPPFHLDKKLGAPQSGLETAEKRKFFSPCGILTSAIQLVALPLATLAVHPRWRSASGPRTRNMCRKVHNVTSTSYTHCCSSRR